MNTILPICVVVALIATAIPVESVGLHGLHRPARSSWGYEEADGPAVWHTLDSDWEVCDTGTRQSPIDLTVDGDSPRVSEPIVFSASYEDTPAEGTFVDNGHTVQFSATMPNTYTFTGGPVGMEEFQFLQLHFHWGSVNTQGSEHTIDGREYPMEMHLVHINSKYVDSDGNLDGLYATEDDGLAVIGFMFKMDPRKDYAPLTTFTDGITALSDDGVAIGDTMPMTGVDLGAFTKYVMDRGYFNYLGSLTTPGCNEVVTWINAKKYLKLSQAQMDVFRSTHHDDNYRPPQPIGDRIISKGLSQFAIDWLS